MDVSDNWHQVEIGKKLVLQLDNTAVAGVGWGAGAGETGGRKEGADGRARNWFCNLTTQKDQL